MHDHTFLVREGRWQISGSTIDVAENANILIGMALVTHRDGTWLLEEQLNEIVNRYEVEPLAAGAPAAQFHGENGAFGPVTGAFVFFEDVILASWRSDDGRYNASEAMRCTDDDHYESRGALFLDGGHVSSWSTVYQRV
jgi:hypothetical protein